MQAEDRPIHFSVELIHGPAPLNKEALQKLYFELSQTKAAYDSTDFSNPNQARFYSRRGRRAQSVCILLPDRALLVEEWTDVPMSSFLERVSEVGPRLLPARGAKDYLMHSCTIRSTFALTHWDDARAFIVDHVCSQEGRVVFHFRRPLGVGGLRFVLPETNEHPGTLHVAIESFRHSQNEVFVEVKGIFGRRRIAANDVDLVIENIKMVRAFITAHVHPFLNQYDTPREEAE
ncbi:MAG: hypothetical protein ACLFTT_13160 [Candidatus Hydrogenedentota bacterium]